MKKAAFFLIPLFLISIAAITFYRLSKKGDYSATTTTPPPPEDDLLNINTSGEIFEEVYGEDEEGNPLYRTYLA